MTARRTLTATIDTLVASHSGTRLTDGALTPSSVVRLACAADHVFELLAEHIVAGKWCPRCARMRTTISDLKARAREHRGVCLDKVYKGPREKYGWRCRRGHEWSTTWDLPRPTTTIRIPSTPGDGR